MEEQITFLDKEIEEYRYLVEADKQQEESYYDRQMEEKIKFLSIKQGKS